MHIDNLIRNTYLQSRIIEIEGKKAVIKCYSLSAGIKWYFISTYFRSYPYASNYKTRMDREMNFLTYRWQEIKVPKLIDIDYVNSCIVREFVDGKELSNAYFSIFGKALRYIHDKGFALGDTKLENFLIKDDKVYVIDAEQAIETNNISYFAWDLLVFLLFTSYKYINDLRTYEILIKQFLSSYEITKEELKEILGIRNISLLSIFPPFHLNIIKKITAEF